MTSILKFLIIAVATLSLASPALAAEKKEPKKKDYSESEFDSLDDTSSTGWKSGTGSKEDVKDKAKEPCPEGQIRDSSGRCREIKK